MPAEGIRDARRVFNPHEKYISQTQKKTNCRLLPKPAESSFPPGFVFNKKIDSLCLFSSSAARCDYTSLHTICNWDLLLFFYLFLCFQNPFSGKHAQDGSYLILIKSKAKIWEMSS